jgi:hypothetical protein
LKQALSQLPWDEQVAAIRPARPLSMAREQAARRGAGESQSLVPEEAATVQMQGECIEPDPEALTSDDPDVVLAIELAFAFGGDETLAATLAAADPQLSGDARVAFMRFPTTSSPQVVDAVHQFLLCPDGDRLVAETGAGEWFTLYVGQLLEEMAKEPELILSLLECDLTANVDLIATNEQVLAAYEAMGQSHVLDLRTTAFELLSDLGELTMEAAVEADALLLTGDHITYLDQAHQVTREMEVRVSELQASIAAFEVAFEAAEEAPTWDQMDEIYQLLLAFDERVMTWRSLLLALRRPAVRWTLFVVAQDIGFEVDPLTAEIETTLQRTLDAYYEATDRFNQAEIERETVLVQTRDLRIHPDDHERRQDWHVLHVPGLVVRQVPMTGQGRPSSRSGREVEEINLVVIHSGGATPDETVETLSSGGHPSHYAVGTDGDILQMYPAGLEGGHAGDANAGSIGIDLAYGPVVPNLDGAQVAFLESGAQLIVAARIINTHGRVSPDIVEGPAHHRDEAFATLIDHIEDLRGPTGNRADLDDVEETLTGVIAHEDIPDSSHSDPGHVYMQRLYFMIPFLEAYESRYGPVEVNDPDEVERVITTFESFLAEGDFLLISQDEVIAQARANLEDDHSAADLDDEIDDIYEGMFEQLAEDYYETQGTTLREQEAIWLERIEDQVDDDEVRFDLSKEGRDFFVAHSPDAPSSYQAFVEWALDAANQTEVQRVRALPDYGPLAAAFADEARGDRAEDMAIGFAVMTMLESRLDAFRAYLETAAPDLLGP